MSGLTQIIAKFVAGSAEHVIPSDALDVAKLGITDTVACMIAGQNEPVVNIVKSMVSPAISNDRARLLFSDDYASSWDAALVNGTAAHALDYDDVAMAAHPSTVLVPAILAEAEALNVSGQSVLEAYVVGYEVWSELWARENGRLHQKGWHPTSAYGALAAAAACARLGGLDSIQSMHAIAIAASQAGGLVANFGTMTKPFHAGRAAQSGVLSARMASCGMTGAPDIVEHPRGFLSAVSETGDYADAANSRLGNEYQCLVHGLNIKKYPMCYSTHRTIDGMLDLKQRYSFEAESVAKIETVMGVTQLQILRNHEPKTALEAKFSEEFAMASAVIAGKVGFAELTDEFVLRADVQELMAKVINDTTDAQDPDDPVMAPDESVTVTLHSGEQVQTVVQYARGHAKSPLDTSDLWQKFKDCTASTHSLEGATRFFNALQDLNAVESLQRLPDMLLERNRL
jgi:2-methylcitrate dehydratase PrpD